MKPLTFILIMLFTAPALAWDTYNRKIAFDQISLAKAKPGMSIKQYQQVQQDVKFTPVKKEGRLHHYQFRHESRTAKGISIETVLATVDGVIYRIEKRREYKNSFDTSAVYKKLFKQYGYHDVSGNLAGSFSTTYCWYGCARTNSGVDDHMSIHDSAPQFLIELIGHTESDLKQGFDIPEKGLIVFTLADGALEQQNQRQFAKIK